MNSINMFKSSALALALSVAGFANADTLAITNATIHTASDIGVLNNATVVIKDGLISAINPENIEADTTVDAQGKILTPGLIGSMNQLGLVEVGAVSRSRDAREKKADITFDASSAFNPRSSVIAYTRKGGITSNVVVPSGGSDMFKGQAFVADLSGDFESIVSQGNAVIVDLGAKSKGSRATELQKLHNKLEDAQKALTKAAKKKADKKGDKKDDKKSEKEPKRDEKVINAILAGDIPVLAYAQRATDLLALIKLKEKFGINLIISGAADAVLIADKLAAAQIPVVVGTVSNLPSSFDSLHASLGNASKLAAAGIKLIFTIQGDTHNLYQLRYDAGIAVANGVSANDALAAVTANVADVFNINAGQVAVGKRADLVLWSGDPFELSTKVEKMWIEGEERTTQSRQDALRTRYTTESDLPRAYTK